MGGRFRAFGEKGKALAFGGTGALRVGMILTYHSMVTAEDIERERRANAKVLKAIFSDPKRARNFLRKAGIKLPRGKTTRHSTGKSPKVAAAR